LLLAIVAAAYAAARAQGREPTAVELYLARTRARTVAPPGAGSAGITITGGSLTGASSGHTMALSAKDAFAAGGIASRKPLPSASGAGRAPIVRVLSAQVYL
jgi:hypothetical protein